MFKNYLRTALRNIWKSRIYSFLNVLGLSVGIACTALILLWVENELTYNHNFEKRDHLYKVYENQTYDGKTATFIATPDPLAAAMKNEIPGVRNTARMKQMSSVLFVSGDKEIYETGSFVDSSFFSMFNIRFKQGNAANVFQQVHSIAISENMAKKFFREGDALGKIIVMDGNQEFTVTGILTNLPENTSFEFEWLAPYSIYHDRNPWLKFWVSNDVTTFAETEPSANIAAINKQLKGFIASRQSGNMPECFLFSMNDWHLYNYFEDGQHIRSGGEIKFVKLFALIAGIILIIACINFMNLATARSEQRAREVGVRKALGAGKGILVGQFLGEALLLSFMAVVLAILITFITLPGFNGLVGKDLAVGILQPLHFGSLIGLGLLVGLLAGSYPAFYLSSFAPVAVLKGMKMKSQSHAGGIRKGLIVFQFCISIILITSTIIIYQQIQHVKDRQLGYDKNNLIYLDLHGKEMNNFESLKNNLLATGVVENAALSYSSVLEFGQNQSGITWQGKDPLNQTLITFESVTAEYVATMGMKIKDGRDFYTNGTDTGSVIINETLAKMISKGDVVGQQLRNGNVQYTIVGVLKDIVSGNVYNNSMPLILSYNPVSANFLSIRLKGGAGVVDALSKVKAVIERDYPRHPFEYKFVDEQFDQLFKAESLIGKLAGIFSLLAIIISCMGLLGLTAYTVERRTKEIGIRKVLGASSMNIVGLIAKGFLKLVAFSCIVAFPVSWFIMSNWLQGYQYRVSIHPWVFLIAGVTACLIALLTVYLQSARAVATNPIKSLRAE